ncbi:hypothetical protein GOODEAATRI_003238 [Goodea atripinnis]|uniref:Uncharacterized protein n=1 Tax=Goodea atripinnis TaxID=208336 RepID=A0ABV0N7G5_9TELE
MNALTNIWPGELLYVFLLILPTLHQGAMAVSSETEPVVPDGREGVASVLGPSSAHVVAAEGGWQPLMGLKHSIRQTLQNAQAPYMSKAYACCWCRDRDLDPVLCSLQDILQYLQCLFDAGRAASTLKVHLAAISITHHHVEGKAGGGELLADEVSQRGEVAASSPTEAGSFIGPPNGAEGIEWASL